MPLFASFRSFFRLFMLVLSSISKFLTRFHLSAMLLVDYAGPSTLIYCFGETSGRYDFLFDAKFIEHLARVIEYSFT